MVASPTLTEKLRRRFFRSEDHPYRIFLSEIEHRIAPDDTLLDAGCGRTADVVSTFAGVVKRAVGADLVEFDRSTLGNVLLLKNDLTHIALKNSSVDIVISRSVLEHLQEPEKVYREINRVLRTGGQFVFLTPNLWEYSSLCAKLIPNKWHPSIVRVCEGRAETDTFPVYYRSNTAASIRRLARISRFRVNQLRHLGQYPSYLMFNPIAFLIGTAYEKVTSRFAMLGPLRGWLLVVLTKQGDHEFEAAE